MFFHTGDFNNKQLGSLFSVLWVAYTILRAVFFVTSELKDELGLTQQEINTALSLQELGTIAGIITSPFGDYLGVLPVVFIGAVWIVASSLLVLVVPSSLAGFGSTRFLFGFGYIVIFSQLQAFMGKNSPPDRFDRTNSIVQSSWGFSSLLGAPLVGALLALGWKWIFLAPAAMYLPLLAIGYRLFTLRGEAAMKAKLAADTAALEGGVQKKKLSELFAAVFKPMFKIIKDPMYIAALVVMTLSSLYLNLVFVNVSPLLTNLGLSTSAISTAGICLGFAELTSTFSVTVAVKKKFPGGRIGYWKAGQVGFMIASLFFSVWGEESTFLAILLITIFTFMGQIGVIAGLSWSSELFPESPSVYMTVVVAFMAFGRWASSFFAFTVYEEMGVAGVGLISAACALLLLVLLIFVEKTRESRVRKATGVVELSGEAVVDGSGLVKITSKIQLAPIAPVTPSPVAIEESK